MQIPFWPPFQGIRNIKFGLDRVINLLDRLDNPHQKLPKVIHFAGTNGKGSTLNFLYQILKANNYKIHCYTSPHLINFNERIILANEEISDDFLNSCLKKCQEAANIEPKIPVTFFEGITVAAFLAFSQVKADFLLLETGMGGRLDATNVVTKVVASIITPISFDHEEFLGRSLPEIATQKAGIIKKNCPVIIAKQSKEALSLLQEKSRENNCQTIIFNEDFSIKKLTNHFEIILQQNTIKSPYPKMFGSHQIDNLTLAIICANKILNITSFLSSKQLQNPKIIWRGRLQEVNYAKLPSKQKLIIDSSHNEAGAQSVKEFLQAQQNREKIVIYSSLKDKNYQKFIKIIAPYLDQLIISQVPNEQNSQDPQIIKKFCDELNIKSQIMLKPEITKLSSKEATIIITGSLYSAGYYLKELQ